ncbi:DoxX family membrane protein [Robertkochia marina]|uniref:DoxX family membrane protein n=1 Tax=Robertkochia marina TaxID=1227945 RepID=A0A4S3LXY5_9FLAO|nr:BT_3928 family protein [Robertkochia marina]THD66429.1 DoxX family membrane protein [Robertkochia marina]TRZ44106.1 DoxX family membrane protein [Robertkochia marina]
MNLITQISRILVGCIFILSGLIKMNDPVGFSFKLDEYFGADVLNLEFLQPLALTFAIILVILEVLLGVALLLGYKKRWTLWSLLAMIVFFTFLTFYSAYFNKVTDCGCFGDAIKLTPWESFTKDVVLLLLILILMAGQRFIQPLFNTKVSGVVMGIVLLGCSFLSYHVIEHLPLVDFRPYEVGANIPQGMSIPDGAPEPVFEYSWKFKVNGEEKVIVTNGDYPQVEGEFIDVETEEVQAGYEPPIHDFTMEKDGVDHTAELMSKDKLFIIVARDLEKSNKHALAALKEQITAAKNKGYEVIGLSASSEEVSKQLTSQYGLDLDLYFCDLTTLKTIVRSNPGILILEKGTITEKLHFNDIGELRF